MRFVKDKYPLARCHQIIKHSEHLWVERHGGPMMRCPGRNKSLSIDDIEGFLNE